MTHTEFIKTYFPNDFVVEVKNTRIARSWFASRMSCLGHKIVKGTGWAFIGQISAQRVGDKRTVYVCRAELLQDQPVAH
jgi:hypothetical protein